MATNVPAPVFGKTGFVAPAEVDILNGVLADMNAAFGGALNITNLETPQGQLASSEAAIIGEANDIFVYYTNQVDPAYAEGRMQDAIARIYFLERNPAQPTVVQALCTGLAGVIIPVGAIAVAVDGNLYVCTGAGVIPGGGNITLSFECTVPGAIACPAGSLNQIYRAISGWDSITNAADGVVGNAVESRVDFEARRAASVAQNAAGSLQAIRGAVLSVPGVLDAYAIENATNAPVTLGDYTLIANSIYVAVVGGDAQTVAQAIWSKKAPGCSYNGNQTKTVYDTSPPYTTPYPSYTVKFEIPPALQTLFEVNIANNAQVPSDAETQIQNAILAAFSGGDGGPRARIGSTLYASRFYPPVTALGSWVEIISLTIGSPNTPIAVISAASITTTVLTVTSFTSGDGSLATGQTITGAGVTHGTMIVSQITGSAGSTGTYYVSKPQTVTSEAMKASKATGNSVSVYIDQVPTLSAADIIVTLT